MTEPMLSGEQLMRRVPCGMQALTIEEAAPPIMPPMFIPVMAPWNAPIGPPTKKPPTPPTTPPTTFPIIGPCLRIVSTKKPATFGIIEVATLSSPLSRNKRREEVSKRVRLDEDKSKERNPPSSLIFAIVLSINFTSTFFVPDFCTACVNIDPNYPKNSLVEAIEPLVLPVAFYPFPPSILSYSFSAQPRNCP